MNTYRIDLLLLACFAIVVASPPAMGVTIFGGSGVMTSGGGVADGTAGTSAIQAATITDPAILDAWLYSHAQIPTTVTGAAAAYANYTGMASSTFDPISADGLGDPLGSFSVSVSGKTNAGIFVTSPPSDSVDALALVGSRVMKAAGFGGIRDDSPVGGSAYVFSRISDTATTLPLGGTGDGAILPELKDGGEFTNASPGGIANGEAYALADGVASFTGTGRGSTSSEMSSQVYGNVNARTYVDATLDNARAAAESAAVATSSALPGPGYAGLASFAHTGVLTQAGIEQDPALSGASSANAYALPGSSSDPAARAGAWDYSFTGSMQPGTNENVYSSSDGRLLSHADTRMANDWAWTGSRIQTLADRDTRTAPAYGAQQYAAAFIQTYGNGYRTADGTNRTQTMAFESSLQDAASNSTVREGSKITTQTAITGNLTPALDSGFLAAGHILSQSTGDQSAQFASSTFTQEAFGKLSASATPYRAAGADGVFINRQDSTLGGIPAVLENDPFQVDIQQGILTFGPTWTGISANAVIASYGVTCSATANYSGKNVKTDARISDLNWIEGSSLFYNIGNLKKSFTYSPAGAVLQEITKTTAAVPPDMPYEQYVESANYAP